MAHELGDRAQDGLRLPRRDEVNPHGELGHQDLLLLERDPALRAREALAHFAAVARELALSDGLGHYAAPAAS
jgi:hypothetical protein